MGYLFDDASSESLTVASATVTEVPLTLAGWFKADDDTIEMAGMSVSVNASNRHASIMFRGDVGGDPIQASFKGTTTVGTASGGSGFVSGTWVHVAAVFGASNSRYLYTDGTAGSEGTVECGTLSADQMSVGERRGSLFFSGSIAHPAVWNVALSAVDIGALASGASPLMVRPDALKNYWPLLNYSPEIEIVSRKEMTLNNTPTWADDPVIYYPDDVNVPYFTVVSGVAAAPAHLLTQQYVA